MGQNNNLAYSLIFKIVDGASAKIREIANVMAEPTAAVEALGDASEASSARQVSAFAKAKDAMSGLGDSISAPIQRMAALGRAAGEAAEKFSTSFAGIGAVVTEGFSLKEVADDEDFWLRFRVNASMGKDAIKELREQIDKTGDHYGVARDKMLAALQAYRDLGGDPNAFGRQANNVAIAVQGTGMDPTNAGSEIASLAKLGITDPKEVLSVLAQMNAQLGGVPDRMNAAAEASGRLVASMQSLHLAGSQGALALNAVYAVAARSSGGNARLARSETDNWLTQLGTRSYQNELSQGLGERITDRNGFVMDPRIIMQKMAAKYAEAMKLPASQQAVSLQRLDGMFGDDASRMFRSVGGEIKSTGHSATIDQVLGAKGDGGDISDRAEKASAGLESAMDRLRNAMKQASESLFVGPLNLLTGALNHCSGAVADTVIALAGLVAIGQGLRWVGGAISGFRLLAASLGLLKVAEKGLAIATAEATAATEAQAAASTGSWIGALVSKLGIIATVTEACAVASWEWAAAVLANPITWVVVAIVAAVALAGVAIYELYEHWSTVWTAIKTVFLFTIGLMGLPIYELFKYWHQIWGAMPGPVKAVCAWLEHAWDTTTKWIGGVWTGLGKLFGGVWDGIKSVSAGVFDWFHQNFSWLFSAFDELRSSSQWWGQILGISIDDKTGGSASSSGTDGGSGTGASGGSGGSGGGSSGSGGGSSSYGGGDSSSGGALTTGKGAPTIDQITAYFKGKGWGANAAAGIAANLYAESKFNAGIVGDKGTAYGLAQWHADRQALFAHIYGHSIQGTSWQDQAAFVDWELRHTERAAGNALAGGVSAGGAGAIMSNMFERPRDRAINAANRAQLAMRIAGGASLATGGGQGDTALATNDGAGGSTGFNYGAVVPSSIYGPGTASNDAASSFADAGPYAGGSEARAHLRISIDSKGRVKTHLDHSANMEAELDRGPGMTLSWG